jgi:hypothetical protein
MTHVVAIVANQRLCFCGIAEKQSFFQLLRSFITKADLVRCIKGKGSLLLLLLPLYLPFRSSNA